MSSRISISEVGMPRDYLLETYKDGTVWITWADGRRRQLLRDYVELYDNRCRAKGEGPDGGCGTLRGDPCNGNGNVVCMGMPGDGSHSQFQSKEQP